MKAKKVSTCTLVMPQLTHYMRYLATKRRRTGQPAWLGFGAANALQRCFQFLPAESTATLATAICSFWRTNAMSNDLWSYFRQRDFAGMPMENAAHSTAVSARDSYIRCLTSRLRWENDAWFSWDISSSNEDKTLHRITDAAMDANWLVTTTVRSLTFTNLRTHDCVTRRSLTHIHHVQFVAAGVVIITATSRTDAGQLEAYSLELSTDTLTPLNWQTKHVALNQLSTAIAHSFALLHWGRVRKENEAGMPNLGVVNLQTRAVQYLSLLPKTAVDPDGPADITALCLVPNRDLAIVTFGDDAAPYESVLLKLSTLETTSRIVCLVLCIWDTFVSLPSQCVAQL